MEEMNHAPAGDASKAKTGLIVGLIVVIALIIGAFAMFNKNTSDMSKDSDQDIVANEDNAGMSDENTAETAPADEDMTADNATITEVSGGAVITGTVTPVTPASAVKTFTVESNNFSFAPKEMKVKKGDTVKITLVNKGGMHDLVIDEFKVATDKIQGEATNSIEFIADKTGEFQYYCSVGKHRQMGMWGTLIVE